MSKSYVTNFNTDAEGNTSFTLNNNDNVKISFANALRRILISNIPVYVMDSVTFYENSSMIDNEFFAHRLKLVPLNCDYLDTIDVQGITLTCKKQNPINENIITVYVRDIVVKNGDEIIDNATIFPQPGIILGKLKMNQAISFEAKLGKDTQEHGGSFYEPVAQSVYTFDIDEKKSKEMMSSMDDNEKEKFATQDIERVYAKNKNGEPDRYNFRFISLGFYSSNNLMKKAIDILVNKLSLIKKEMKNSDSDKVFIYQNKEDTNFIIFDINNENDTIGNLLSTYLTDDNDVLYSGYIIEHPLKKNFLLKIQLKENNSLENIIKKMDEKLDYLIKIATDIYSAF